MHPTKSYMALNTTNPSSNADTKSIASGSYYGSWIAAQQSIRQQREVEYDI